MENKIMEIPISLRPPVIENIRSSVNRYSKRAVKAGVYGRVPAQGPDAKLLRVKPANEWMKQEYGKPAPRKLLGDLWYEGELCILFADTNLGKSIFAVQIGNCLAQGDCFGPLANNLEPLTPVLYIDFELCSKQFETRYHSSSWGSYTFGQTFYRAEFNPGADDPIAYDSYQEYLKNAIEYAIRETKAQVLIIDNITYIGTGTERAKDAMPLMKELKALKTKYKLSLLVLAHTPKRNPYKLLTANDMQGSKMLINFCDSAFAIGESHTVPGGRYIKQIKQRNTTQLYGADNVMLCHVSKNLSFLQFDFDGYACEREHLLKPKHSNKDFLKDQIKELLKQGLTYREIGDKLKISKDTAYRYNQQDADH